MMSIEKGTFAWMLFLAFVVGMIAIWVLGFYVFDWKTTGSVDKLMAEHEVTLKAEICAGQFMADPQFEEHKAGLMKLDAWQRNTYLEKQGSWAIMPGDTSPDYGVPRACANKLSAVL